VLSAQNTRALQMTLPITLSWTPSLVTWFWYGGMLLLFKCKLQENRDHLSSLFLSLSLSLSMFTDRSRTVLG
jgi:hypothetical protein